MFSHWQSFRTGINATRVCVGYDARETSSDLANSVIDGLVLQGVDVLQLGLIGTEGVQCYCRI